MVIKVTYVVSGQHWIEQSSKELEELTKIQTCMTVAEFENYPYTVPKQFYPISERVKKLAKKVLKTAEEESEFREKIKACQLKCVAIIDQLNADHCLIAESIFADARLRMTSKRNVPLADMDPSFDLRKRITDLREVNKSLNADYYLNKAEKWLCGEKSSKQDIDRKAPALSSSSASSSSGSSSSSSSASYADSSFSPGTLPDFILSNCTQLTPSESQDPNSKSALIQACENVTDSSTNFVQDNILKLINQEEAGISEALYSSLQLSEVSSSSSTSSLSSKG